MKYVLLLLIISLLSCDKDNEDPKPPVQLPTVVKIETASEIVNGVARPKFSITLDVPDTTVVASLYLYQNAQFPQSQSGLIGNPKTGVYTVIDNTATYPPSTPIKYFAFFAMKDQSYVSYYPFEVK